MVDDFHTHTPSTDRGCSLASANHETPSFQHEDLAAVSSFDRASEQPQVQAYTEHIDYVDFAPTADAAIEHPSNAILEACLLRYFVEELAHWVSDPVRLQYCG